MGNIGRFFCVALPFALTAASLVALLVAGLAGVADKNLYMFQVNTTGLSVSPDYVSRLVNGGGGSSGSSGSSIFHDKSLLGTRQAKGNITAADLSLSNLYDVSLWGYCYTPQNGARACTKPAFNWAEGAFGAQTSQIHSLISATGQNITIPKEITNAMTAFSTISRWTEITFIIAYVCLGVELLFGLFANCSRAWSCVTWLVAGLATVAVCTAASLATAMSVVVVGSLEASAKVFGVKASFHTGFLAAVWISAAFALGAGFFWLFTICCCKPEHRSRNKSHRDSQTEKLMPQGSYQPLHEPQHNGFYNNSAPQYGGPRYPSGGRSDLAYEPYSHGRV